MLFFRALYFLLWIDLLSTSKQAFAQYQSIHKGTADRVIIFVHGLFGDPSTSFSAGPNNPSWPELMSTDGEGIGDAKPLSAYTIATFSYPAKCSDGLSIPEVANYLMRELQDKRVLEGGTKLYFIAHSLGAIVVKQMLIRAHNANGADRDLFTQTKGVFPNSNTIGRFSAS